MKYSLTAERGLLLDGCRTRARAQVVVAAAAWTHHTAGSRQSASAALPSGSQVQVILR